MNKIISWNVNGIRAIYKKNFNDFLYSELPNILAVQEIKANKLKLSSELINPKNYKTYYYSAEKEGYSGVALFVKEGIKYDIEFGMGVKEFDVEGRTITFINDDFIFINSYFPNSQSERKRLTYKLDFCDAIEVYLKKYKDKKILISGDFNIAHTAIDLSHPKDNENSPGYYIEERNWIDNFLNKDFKDSFRLFNKDSNNYTWWSYRTKARERNIGWRIDYHCVNNNLVSSIINSCHNTNIFGSDHCPVSIILDFKL